MTHVAISHLPTHTPDHAVHTDPNIAEKGKPCVEIKKLWIKKRSCNDNTNIGKRVFHAKMRSHEYQGIFTFNNEENVHVISKCNHMRREQPSRFQGDLWCGWHLMECVISLWTTWLMWQMLHASFDLSIQGRRIWNQEKKMSERLCLTQGWSVSHNPKKTRK